MTNSAFDIDKLGKKVEYQILLHFLPHKFSYAQKVRGEMILKDLRKGSILDLGTGCGWISRLAQEKGFRVTGIDSADKVIKESAWFDKITGRKLTIKKASVYELPFAKEKFDSVILSEMLEHLDNPKKGLTEAYRVLKRNGRFKLLIPGYSYNLVYDKLFNFLRTSEGFNYDVRMTKSLAKYNLAHAVGYEDEHRFRYTISSLKVLLEEVGFKVERISNTEFLSPFVNTLLCNTLKVRRSKIAWIEKLDVFLMNRAPLLFGSDWMFSCKKV